jgi:hypothetical protein
MFVDLFKIIGIKIDFLLFLYVYSLRRNTMKNLACFDSIQRGWQRILAIAATVVVSAAVVFSMSGCSSGDSTPTVAAPAVVTAFTATAGENVATLQWSPPAASTTAGLPDSYEIYHSTTATTAETIVNPANFVTTIPVVSGKTVYTYTDIGLAGTTTYYFVVTAKNAGGETPSPVASAKPTGPPTPATYGNNLSAALIFADDIGVTNLALDPTKSWAAGASAVTAIDTNTGLRPLAAEIPAISAVQATLPYLPVPSAIDPLYFEQKSVNTWQGEWAAASGVQQVVDAKWGDNMLSASLKASAKIRIEMALTKTLTTPMTAYTMKLLSGSGTTELQGTNGVVYNPTTAFVMATNAHLIIQKLDGTTLEAAIVDQALFDSSIPDGLNKLSAEIPVSGSFTYGFVWNPATYGATAGTYRVTFKLDPQSEFGVGNPANNTSIANALNGIRVNDTEAYIDITLQ